MQNRLEIILDYIKRRLNKPRPKLVIFNGKIFRTLLIGQDIIKNGNYEQVKITNKFSLYFFDIDSIKYVLFDKFFQSHYWGITDYHRKTFNSTSIFGIRKILQKLKRYKLNKLL